MKSQTSLPSSKQHILNTMVSISHEHMIYFNATKAEITSHTNFVNYVLYNRTALIYTAYRDINNYQSYQPTALVSQNSG